MTSGLQVGITDLYLTALTSQTNCRSFYPAANAAISVQAAGRMCAVFHWALGN